MIIMGQWKIRWCDSSKSKTSFNSFQHWDHKTKKRKRNYLQRQQQNMAFVTLINEFDLQERYILAEFRQTQ